MKSSNLHQTQVEAVLKALESNDNLKTMAIKKTVVKKNPKVGEARGTINTKAQLRFVSFKFGAVIPTQSFGNVSPEIVVEAPSYEEARDFAVPKILDLYNHFAEVKPSFLGKITVEEKTVAPAVKVAFTPEVPAEVSITGQAPAVAPVTTTAPVAAPAPVAANPEAIQKAEKAISLAATKPALEVIRNQIANSVKIAPDAKPALIVLCDARYQELDTF